MVRRMRIILDRPIYLRLLLSKDFGQAEVQFERILALDPYRIDDVDVFSDILYVTNNRLKLSRLAHEFLALDKDRPEVCCLVGT
jgi:anaphase-promoting complex subunit 8